MREMVFACGIEGSEPEHAEALEQLVLGILEAVATEGVPKEKLESVLHQLELHQREISGDSYPFGLQLILTALGNATHYADPIAALNLDPALETLRTQIQDPEYIKTLARKLLLENAHRVTLVMKPDKALSEKRREQEARRLLDLKTAMDDAEKQVIVEQAAALAERQAQEDDESILPNVVNAEASWWFPEKPGELPTLFGALESNANVLTIDDPQSLDPVTGSWCDRALLCKVYKE